MGSIEDTGEELDDTIREGCSTRGNPWNAIEIPAWKGTYDEVIIAPG
jgi:hypothetical protein